jgi:nucleotide-binding universal stress UspA family protein
MLSPMLVPLDGTPESESALPMVRTLARCTGAEILLLRVVGDTTCHVAESEAVAQLEWTAAELRGDGLAVRTDVLRGDPAERIVEIACRIAGLVVMATREGRGLGRLLFGSVAERVVARSAVPVLLCQPGGRRPTRLRTLLVPVDGTEGDLAALEAAVGLADAAGAGLFLLHVVVPLYLYAPSNDPLGGISLNPYVEQDWDDAARHGAQAYVDGLVRLAGRLGVDAEGCAVPGPVADTIVGAAGWTRADLIVMSTHARTGAARALHGSVADAVVHAADHAVLLVHRDTPASRRSPAGWTPPAAPRADESTVSG